jgi:hypothetical protein
VEQWVEWICLGVAADVPVSTVPNYDVVRGNPMTNHEVMPLYGVLIRWLLNVDYPV